MGDADDLNLSYKGNELDGCKDSKKHENNVTIPSKADPLIKSKPLLYIHTKGLALNRALFDVFLSYFIVQYVYEAKVLVTRTWFSTVGYVSSFTGRDLLRPGIFALPSSPSRLRYASLQI